MRSYHCNMAAFLQLGKWFDVLREQGVYDNTRIILVADHGYSLEQFEDMLFGNRERSEDRIGHQPLDGLLDAPVNPFTGNAITDEAKDAEALHIFFKEYLSPYPSRTTFYPGHWFALRGQNIFDLSAWSSLGYY